MNGRRAIAVLLLLCGLFCFIATANALGAKLNTTAVTCKAVETGAQFSDEHCTKAGKGKGYAHEVIPVKTQTQLSGTNEKTGGETKSSVSAVLRFEASKVEIEVVCPSLTTSSFLQNEEKENESKEKEMLVKGEKTPVTYTSCTVQGPAEQKCKVASEKFQLAIGAPTSFETKMAIEFQVFGTSITIENCLNESLNGKFQLEGSIRAEPNGATLNTTGAATALTLLVNGSPAELVSTVTLRARLDKSEGETIPISFTTG